MKRPFECARRTLIAAVLSSAAFAQIAPTHSNLMYAVVGSAPLRLDLYLPTSSPAPHPTLIFIHGGGWAGGSKAPIPALCASALNQGFAVASLDYRLTTQAALFAPEPVIFPAQIHDVKGAVRWLRANAATFQLDPTRFASFGTSAGGHLSALLGWNLPGQGVGDIRANLDNPAPPYPTLVQRANWANPITWVDANDPPMFIGHGTNDTAVPVRQSTRLSAALFAFGVEHDFRAVPLAGHGLGGAINDVGVAFLRAKLLGPDLPSVGTPLCAGDSTLDACPCGNESSDGANTGCVHSLFVGANLNAIGAASIAHDTLVLRADSMPTGTVLFFQGPAFIAGGSVLDDGVRCAGSPIARLGTKPTVLGWASYPAPSDARVSVRGAASAGDTLYYQAWYRDAAPHCTVPTANLTNALAITWLP